MRRAAELLGAELVVIEGAGHMAHREDPEGFARFVRTVVATAAPTAAADRNGRSDT
jgi:pimeloyl-ACP methyl ester carboxylesterase